MFPRIFELFFFTFYLVLSCLGFSCNSLPALYNITVDIPKGTNRHFFNKKKRCLHQNTINIKQKSRIETALHSTVSIILIIHLKQWCSFTTLRLLSRETDFNHRLVREMTSNISKLSDFPRNRANSVTPQLTAVPTSPHHSKLKDRKQQQNTLNNLTVGPKHRRSEVEDDLLNVAKVLTKTGRSDLSRVTGQSSQNLDDPGDDGTHRRHSKRTAANRPVPVIRRNSKPTISSGLSCTGSTTQEQTSRRFGSMSSHRSSKVGGTFRRNKIKNEGPKRQRHAVQLDQLAKLQRMTDFSEEAEHEFLVNMYKLRGTFQDRLSDHQYKSDDKEFNQRARFLSGKTAQLGSYGKGSYGKGKGSYGKGSTMPHETEKLERHSSGGIKQMISDVLRRKTGDLAPGRGKPGR